MKKFDIAFALILFMSIVWIYFACTGCNTVKKTYAKSAARKDSAASSTESFSNKHTSDSSAKATRQNDYKRLSVELAKGGVITATNLNPKYKLDSLLPVEFFFPVDSKIVYETGSTKEVSEVNKQALDTNSHTAAANTRVHEDKKNQEGSKDKNSVPLAMIIAGTVLLALLMIGIALWVRKKLS